MDEIHILGLECFIYLYLVALIKTSLKALTLNHVGDIIAFADVVGTTKM